MRRGRLLDVENCCFHLTHRCLERRFLLRFERNRRNYVARLRETAQRFRVDVLAYCITSNHVHLLLWSESAAHVSSAMRHLQGLAARDYNRRKKRSGPFWGDRYHPTLVETGVHLSRCLFYIDMNMVRAKAVAHPSQWRASGYHELSGRRQRYRVLNVDRLLWCLGMPGDVEGFRQWYTATLDELAGCAYGPRESVWTASVAVGSRQWVEGLADRIVTGRTSVMPVESPSASLLKVGEPQSSYALAASSRHIDRLLSHGIA